MKVDLDGAVLFAGVGIDAQEVRVGVDIRAVEYSAVISRNHAVQVRLGLEQRIQAAACGQVKEKARRSIWLDRAAGQKVV